MTTRYTLEELDHFHPDKDVWVNDIGEICCEQPAEEEMEAEDFVLMGLGELRTERVQIELLAHRK